MLIAHTVLDLALPISTFVRRLKHRPDSIDPALRRPGRFDREIYFPLPPASGRLDILRAVTHAWEVQPEERLLQEVARVSEGYAGACLLGLSRAYRCEGCG